jgi:hypothetical protein
MSTNDIKSENEKSENEKDKKFNFFHMIELFKMPFVIMTLIKHN